MSSKAVFALLAVGLMAFWGFVVRTIWVNV